MRLRISVTHCKPIIKIVKHWDQVWLWCLLISDRIFILDQKRDHQIFNLAQHIQTQPADSSMVKKSSENACFKWCMLCNQNNKQEKLTVYPFYKINDEREYKQINPVRLVVKISPHVHNWTKNAFCVRHCRKQKERFKRKSLRTCIERSCSYVKKLNLKQDVPHTSI